MTVEISENFDMEVPFYDVDSYRVVWHGNYPKYFEIARCKLLEKINFTYDDMEKANFFYPVIDLQVKYIKPLIFKQKVNVSAKLVEWENCLRINYLITDIDTNERITKGQTTQVAVAMPNNEMLLDSPDVFKQKILEFLDA